MQLYNGKAMHPLEKIRGIEQGSMFPATIFKKVLPLVQQIIEATFFTPYFLKKIKDVTK